jgi:hypothetical protein
MVMELVSIENAVYFIQHSGVPKSKAVVQLACALEVSVPTIYRWLKDGDHFVHGDKNLNQQCVFKLVKCKKVEVS